MVIVNDELRGGSHKTLAWRKPDTNECFYSMTGVSSCGQTRIKHCLAEDKIKQFIGCKKYTEKCMTSAATVLPLK
jgi:hypothetical protein